MRAASTVNYTLTVLDQYTAVGALAATYNANGDLAFDGTFTYGYDAESRLVRIKQGANSVSSHAFDAQGRRKLKTIGATTTVYVTDADDREVLEYDGTSRLVQRWYAYSPVPTRR